LHRGGQDGHVALVVRAVQVRKCTGGHAVADVGGVARLVEDVGVDVERGAHARVPEDPADVNDVEAEI
jgi:hypothetical protein